MPLSRLPEMLVVSFTQAIKGSVGEQVRGRVVHHRSLREIGLFPDLERGEFMEWSGLFMAGSVMLAFLTHQQAYRIGVDAGDNGDFSLAHLLPVRLDRGRAVCYSFQEHSFALHPQPFLPPVEAGCQGVSRGRETVMVITHATIERGREDVVLLFDVERGSSGRAKNRSDASAIAAAVSSSGNQAISTGGVGGVADSSGYSQMVTLSGSWLTMGRTFSRNKPPYPVPGKLR